MSNNEGILLSVGADGVLKKYEEPYITIECETKEDYEKVEEIVKQYNEAVIPKPLEEWHEECGDCLWWSFPIEEPPYCGCPLDANFPDYVTHFTKFAIPNYPKESEIVSDEK